MKRSILACLFVTVSSSTASAEPIHRHGFTSELGMGIAQTTIAGDAAKIGLAPLSVTLGGFVSPDVALGFRMAGTSYFERRAGVLHQQILGFYGPTLQGWLSDQFFVGGGIGFALLGENAFLAPSKKPDSGYGLTIRGGWVFAAGSRHAFALVGELFPATVGDRRVLGSALNLEWQYY